MGTCRVRDYLRLGNGRDYLRNSVFVNNILRSSFSV